MKKVFVDSNIFIRLLTQDDPLQCEQASRLFEAAASGALELVTGPPVFFEVAWALARLYKRSRQDILLALNSILAHPHLSVTDAMVAKAALALAEQKDMNYADAYIVALAESAEADALASFNRKHVQDAVELYPL